MGPGEIDPSQHQGGELAGIAPPPTTTARVTFDRRELSRIFGPVSYTHLDVYKRQSIPSTSWNTSRTAASCNMCCGNSRVADLVICPSGTLSLQFNDRGFFARRRFSREIFSYLSRVIGEKLHLTARPSTHLKQRPFRICLLYTSRCV